MVDISRSSHWGTSSRKKLQGNHRPAKQRDELAPVAVGTPVTERPPAEIRTGGHAAFRGCAQITSQSDISGTCTLPSDETIKSVLV